MLEWIRTFIRRWWHPFVPSTSQAGPALDPVSAPGPVLEPKPELKIQPKRHKKEFSDADKEKEGTGGTKSFLPYHFEDLLNSLPAARQLLSRLEKTVPEEYNYFARVGARLLSPDAAALHERVEPEVLKALPARGCVFFPPHDNSDNSPFFLIFTKVKPPPYYGYVRAEAFYRFYFAAGMYDGKTRRLHSKVFCYDVLYALDSNGVARALPEAQHDFHMLPISKKNPMLRRMGSKALRRSYLGFAPILEHHYNDRKAHNPDTPDTKEEWLGFLMYAALNFYGTTFGGLQVRARKNGKAVTFTISLNDAKKFFKDRATGGKKKIFHYVEQHMRAYKNRQIAVSAHYRGLREFRWHGEDIYISPPEQSDTKFDVTSFEFEKDQAAPNDMIESKGVGDIVRNATERPFRIRKGQFIPLPSGSKVERQYDHIS